MMNSIIENMLNHRSIRNYTDEKISHEDLNLILKAACNGSTLGNMQLFSIITTEDKAMMEKMAPYHFNQPIATNAPLILTFCADFHRFNQYCKYRNCETEAYSNFQSYHWAVTDAIIAAQNACSAAESLGLGLCWLGTITYNVDNFIEILHLPKHVIPVACISIGHPAENPELTQKLPLEAIVHSETYQDYDEQKIDQFFQSREIDPYTIETLKENKMDNLAQDYTERRYKRIDNEYFAKVLYETLKKQGFNFPN